LIKIKGWAGRTPYVSGMSENTTIEKILRDYGGPAPRYTSYPSAAHFQGGFSSALYDSLLKEQPEESELSIYIHIPFCRMLCHYCGCFTKVTNTDGPIRDYLDLVEKEVRIFGQRSRSSFTISHIHFGGGSPNLLAGRDIERLLDIITANSKIKDTAEIAMECDPRQMTAVKTRDYALAGINRISLGVQDLNDKTQQAINRLQPFSQIADCVLWMRKAGIKSVNFDLMYGLPYQTPATVADNARKAVALGAERIALFGYAHVPWMKPHQKIMEKHGLPGPLERYEQAEAARAVFLEQGYVAVGMDHFALPGDPLAAAAQEGRLHRNFQGYTTDRAQAVAGFGMSAISSLPEAYVQNTSDPGFYRECLEHGKLPVEKGRSLCREDRLRADIIERLMCYFEVDAGEICRLHGYAPGFMDSSLKKVRDMEKDGLVKTDGTVVKVTKKGEYFIRTVCACFDSYLEDSKKYARAV
jgi:oxygen-independent coproporphyrinogen-3 oxidase